MFIGIVIVILGIVCLLNSLNLGFVIDWNIVWPCLFIMGSVYLVIKNKTLSFWNVLLMFIGIWSLLFNLNIISVKLGNLFWPIVLILLGFSIIFEKMNWNKKVSQNIKVSLGRDGRVTYNGIFGGVTEKVNNNDFKGAVINGIFGSVELDLTQIHIKDNITIDANSIFGGIELKMSNDYNAVINSFAIFGGNENKLDNKFDEKKKTIYINCVSIFGGTEIK